MRIINVERAIIIFLIIGTLTVAAGCARWPDGPGPEPGGTEYQLEITVEVKGVINTSDGIYYIGLDTDGQTGIGVGSDIDYWEGNYYYIKLDSTGCYLYPKDESSSLVSLNSSYIIFDNEKKLQVTIALSDLGDPKGSIGINVVTTDSDGYTTYDHLDDNFYINTELYSKEEGISSTDLLEEEEVDFDITEVKAVITN